MEGNCVSREIARKVLCLLGTFSAGIEGIFGVEEARIELLT